MNDEQVFEPQTQSQIDQAVLYLREHGLATPTLFVLGIARPLGFVAAHCLALLQPFAVDSRWHDRIGQMAAGLEDDTLWTRLEKLLE